MDSHVLSTWPTEDPDGRVHVAPVLGPDHECGDRPLGNTLLELQKAAGCAVADLGGFIPEVIHAHDYRAIVGAEALARRYGARLVVTKHSMHPLIVNPDPRDPRRVLFYRYVDELQREGFSQADAVILLTEEIRGSVETYREELDDFRKVSVVPNGVEVPALDEDSTSRSGRIVFVGRLEPAKGADLLVEAVGRLDEETAAGVEVHVYGRGSLEEVLRDRAAVLGPRARIELHGFIPPDSVPEVMRRAELCVVPSRHDVYPLVALEAMAAATPVVASRVGGLPAQLGQGARGLLVEPEDAASLARAITYAVTHRPEMRTLARAARDWVIDSCSWPQVAARTAALYRSVLDSE